MKTIKYIITGKVQGVWYRDSTKKLALELGMVGSAINMASGQVEVIATGDSEQHQHLKQFLDIGPEAANVQSVDQQELELKSFEGFITG